MAGQCATAWLLAKQKRLNSALSIDDADEECEDDCRARCSSLHIGISFGKDLYHEDYAVLQDD